jgi:CheY-like chemotaxis protein
VEAGCKAGRICLLVAGRCSRPDAALGPEAQCDAFLGARDARVARVTQDFVQCPVLVVEDDAEVRGALGDVLHAAGYDVVMAANGKEALRVLAHLEVPPGLILLDLTMPRMDGFTLLEKLQADEALRALPVLVVTALEDPVPAGAVGLLRKPVQVKALLAAVNRHCRRLPE